MVAWFTSLYPFVHTFVSILAHSIPFVHTFKILVNKVCLKVCFPLFTRILNVWTNRIKCAKNSNKRVNKGKQACKSNNRRERIPIRWILCIIYMYYLCVLSRTWLRSVRIRTVVSCLSPALLPRHTPTHTVTGYGTVKTNIYIYINIIIQAFF